MFLLLFFSEVGGGVYRRGLEGSVFSTTKENCAMAADTSLRFKAVPGCLAKIWIRHYSIAMIKHSPDRKQSIIIAPSQNQQHKGERERARRVQGCVQYEVFILFFPVYFKWMLVFWSINEEITGKAEMGNHPLKKSQFPRCLVLQS